MNDRIKELALRAGMDHPAMGEIDYSRFSYKKFAELIVKECADIADQESKRQRSNYGKQAADCIWNTIKNRFGV